MSAPAPLARRHLLFGGLFTGRRTGGPSVITDGFYAVVVHARSRRVVTG